MMNAVRIKKWLLAGFVIFLVSFQANYGQPFDPWPEVKSEMKPWTRWWWMGSAVDKKDLGDLLETYSGKGFGGVEVTPIYGAKGFEDRYIPFLSERWMQMLHYVCEKSDSLRMGVDMNTGTGWPFGGPQVSVDNAASKVILKQYACTGGQAFTEKIAVGDTEQARAGAILQALVAYDITSGSRMDLTGEVGPDSTLNTILPKGEWTLIAVFCGKTFQKVKRAAPSGEGYTFDHFSYRALDQYLSRFDSAFRIHPPHIRCLFNDSYEVYNASWTPLFFDQFISRRGYDLKKFIPEFSGAGDPAIVARVKYDYRETMSDMLLDNFTTGWSRWAHDHHMHTRNQAHGSPANLLDLYAAVDIPEIETFGSTFFPIPGLRHDTPFIRTADHDPLFLRLAASAAHISGKSLVSCESFTWLGEHFRVALSQCKPEAEEAFLAGVNHLVYHGTPYSPEDVAWPGWLFYATVNFAPSNSFWDHIEGLNQYITRCQSILQTGVPDNDIMVYWPIHDQWQQADKLERMILIHEGRAWFDFPQVRGLSAAGYTFDFISDRQIGEIVSKDGSLVTTQKGSHYKALFIPFCRYMPLKILQKIMELADSGAYIIFEKLPEGVPGLFQYEQQDKIFMQLLKKIKFTPAEDSILEAKSNHGKIVVCRSADKALEFLGIKPESLVDMGLRFIRRKTEEGMYYFLVNHTSRTVDTTLALNAEAKTVLWMDPLTGEWSTIPFQYADQRVFIRVQLSPGQTSFVLAGNKSMPGLPGWHYYRKSDQAITVEGPWYLEFISGGPDVIPGMQLQNPVPWTSLKRPETDCFSGTARYTAKIILPDAMADEYLLVPGNIYESARVWINGKEAGIIWSVPFQLNVGKFLHPGTNTLCIEVANLMANRIREMDRQGIEWKRFHDINIVNLSYRPFSAADWSILPSGLEGPVKLVPLKREHGDR